MGAYLYDHQNPNAPFRANGKRFWGYPTRNAPVQIIAVHTAENAFDQIGADTGAEGVARYQASTERPSSYHRLVDRDSAILMLPDEATSFGVVGYNSRALNVSFAMRAADWGNPVLAEAAEPSLYRAADIVAEWCRKYAIPVRLLTKAQVDAGAKGITSHGRLDPARRSDPGASFPWDHFLALVNARLTGQPAPVEDDMFSDADRKTLNDAMALLAHFQQELDMLRRDTRELGNAVGSIQGKLDVAIEPLQVKNLTTIDGVIES